MFVIKKNGDVEPLQEEKIKTVVARIGGNLELANRIVEKIKASLPDRVPVELIYKTLFDEVHKENPVLGCKLNLKKAISELGPTGFPFEQYFAKVLEHSGYTAVLPMLFEGKCVQHEMDVYAVRGDDEYLVECKFHQYWQKKSDIKTALYVSAKVSDINEKNKKQFKPWIATNTKFSLDAVDYSHCQGVKITAWKHPLGESLENLIEKSNCYPITILPSGTREIFEHLISHKIVLIEDFLKLSKEEIQEISGASAEKCEYLIQEANLLRPTQ